MHSYTITNKDCLYRRFPISEKPNYAIFWKLDENGRKIPSSAAFKTKYNEGLSVNIAALTTPKLTVENSEKFGVAEISAATPINLGYQCNHDPKPENDAHALIMGDTKPIAKKLSKSVTQVFQF